jgi:exonuclease III
VAILARWAPVVTRPDLPGDDGDRQCRYLEAAVNGVLVASIYAPKGNPQPGPKFDYKLAWLKRLNAHAAELYTTGAPFVLAGDYNVVPCNPSCAGNRKRTVTPPGPDGRQNVRSWVSRPLLQGRCSEGPFSSIVRRSLISSLISKRALVASL